MALFDDMDLTEEQSFRECLEEPLDYENEPVRKTKVKVDTAALEKNRRADKKAMKTCAECNKKFSAKLSCGVPWLYHDHYNGRKHWFCSWNCLSRNRKARENDK